MDLKTYILRRLLHTIPIIIGIATLIFFIFNIVGGDPALTLLGKYAKAKQIASLRHEMGLDKSLFLQYIDLLKSIFTFDFGKSWHTKQNIITSLKESGWISFTLSFPPFIISCALSIIIAMVSAFYRGQFLDKTLVLISIILMSISILSYILLFQWFFAFKLDWFEIAGYDKGFPNFISYILLPGIIIIFLSIGSDIRLYRTILLDEINQDYIRTARAKGLSEVSVLFKHVLKNAMIPIVTNLITQLPFLFLGSLLIENFFAIPGLGNFIVTAINTSDFPVIKAVTILSAIVFVLFNLLTDIIYTILDPRVKL